MLSIGLESSRILFNSVKNLWLKSLIFYLGYILVLNNSNTKVVGVLSSPNFLRNLASKSSQVVIEPCVKVKYHVYAFPSNV